MHWKFWSLLAITGWTAWGIVTKFALRRIDWARLEVLSGLVALIAMLIIAPSGYRIKLDNAHLIGLMAATLGAFGGVTFFIALSKGPASVIVPLTSLYVVGVFLFGVLFFGEALTLKKVLGVLLAAAAMFLLASEEA
jgi:transporter family protein